MSARPPSRSPLGRRLVRLDAPRRPVQPDARFMRVRLSRIIAFAGGAGLAPFAAGTVGTLWAWVVFALGSIWIAPATWLAIVAVGFGAGVWACGRAARDLGVDDHGAIVWDEVVAFWLVLAVLPPSFGWQLAGFALFRLLDIAKPPPVRWFDRNLKGGLGVMADDLVAAFVTLLVLAWWAR